MLLAVAVILKENVFAQVRQRIAKNLPRNPGLFRWEVENAIQAANWSTIEPDFGSMNFDALAKLHLTKAVERVFPGP